MPTSRFAILLLLASATGAQAQSTSLTFKVVKAGPVCEADQPSRKVLRTAEQFANYWSAHFNGGQAPKGIDWTKSELVAIQLGHRGSRGYEVRVTSVVYDGTSTVVNWSERLPIKNVDAHAQPSSPFEIVSFPAQPGKVTFHGTVENPRRPFDSGDAFPKDTFLTGSHCLMKTESTSVIESADAMADVWSSAFGKNTPPPAVDFTKWRLVAIFLGQRPTPGYEPAVSRIARIGPHEVQVVYSETKPSPGTILPQLVTNPFIIIKLPATKDTVTIQKA